jgi:bacterioferritin (cytochrome b1)
MPFVQDVTRTLQKILRGELAAVEAYERALHGLRPDDPDLSTFERLTREHAEAAETLQAHLSAEGEPPEQGSGAWGTYTRLLEKAMDWIDEDGGLKNLKEGEVHGLAEYRTSLGHDDLAADLRAEIRDGLIPRQEEHIAELDGILKRRERIRHGV